MTIFLKDGKEQIKWEEIQTMDSTENSTTKNRFNQCNILHLQIPNQRTI
jgi:hypothetical protein